MLRFAQHDTDEILRIATQSLSDEQTWKRQWWFKSQAVQAPSFVLPRVAGEETVGAGTIGTFGTTGTSKLWSVLRRTDERTNPDNAEKKFLNRNLVGGSDLAKTAREQQIKK
jgi:hypothetical protein